MLSWSKKNPELCVEAFGFDVPGTIHTYHTSHESLKIQQKTLYLQARSSLHISYTAGKLREGEILKSSCTSLRVVWVYSPRWEGKGRFVSLLLEYVILFRNAEVL